MPKFAANLTMMFNEFSFLDRFAAARETGFEAVEFMFPYAYEIDQIRHAIDSNGLRLVLHNLPAGDWSAGSRGIACQPDQIDAFRSGVRQAIEYATALECPRLNCLPGIPDQRLELEDARETLVGNLRYASAALEQAGIELIIEPVNTRDVPGAFVSRTRHALSIMDEVGSDNLKLQFDIYHAQVMEGDLMSTIERNLDRIGHIQVADNPGRHEPGTGEINFAYLLRRIDELGYAGWVGCEYKPSGATSAGLGWLDPHRTNGTVPRSDVEAALSLGVDL